MHKGSGKGPLPAGWIMAFLILSLFSSYDYLTISKVLIISIFGSPKNLRIQHFF
jgi:hypothetical protein